MYGDKCPAVWDSFTQSGIYMNRISRFSADVKRGGEAQR